MITMQLSYTALKHSGITIYSERWTVLGLFMKFFGEWKKCSFSLFLFNQHTNKSMLWNKLKITEKHKAFHFYFISNKRPYATNMDDVLSRIVLYFL